MLIFRLNDFSHLSEKDRKEKEVLFGRLFTFTFVRHPFDRLVSAYQDKVVDSQNYVGWHKQIKRIVKKRFDAKYLGKSGQIVA
jgi:hypothetical protein